ncbi:MAG: HEAT repeat domain-containing protein [Candidatus Sumerlaeota bacterium]|nr:HEAT repeat domain-containing protein [Candidatus Sumerlaeota bacterium]
MTRKAMTSWCLVACLLILSPAASLRAAEANLDDIIQELKGEAPAKPHSPEELQAAYAKIIDGLMPGLSAEDMKTQGEAQQTLQKLSFRAGRPDAENERAAISKAMGAKLKSDIPAAARVWIIREMERCGRVEAVEALATAMNDKDPLVRETARRALQKNPSPEAAQALRKALNEAGDAPWRASLIDALGFRREAQDAALFQKEASSADEAVRMAAVRALGRTGDKSAADVIAAAATKGSDLSKKIATDALVSLADHVAQSDKPAAIDIYRKMIAGGPAHLKCAGLLGLGRTAGEAEMKTLLEAMSDPEREVCGAAVEALTPLGSPQITQAMIERSKTLSPDARGIVIAGLGRRGDKAALPACLEAAALQAPSPEAAALVRIAAYRALGALGDASVAVTLLKAAAASKGEEQTVAREVLGNMRAAVAAVPDILKLAEGPDAATRSEAYLALGVLCGGDRLGAVIALLMKTDKDSDRDQLSKAIGAVAARVSDSERRAAPVLEALKSATGPAQIALIASLARIGGEKSLAAARSYLANSDSKIREAAVRALSDWIDPEAMPDLLSMAKGGVAGLEEKHQILALRGYIRLIGVSTTKKEKRSALELYAEALTLAKRPEEIRMALGPLGDIKDAKVFDLLLPALSNPAVAEEASAAAVKVAKTTNEKKAPESFEQAMIKVLEVAKKADTRKQAEEALAKIQNAKPKSPAPKK